MNAAAQASPETFGIFDYDANCFMTLSGRVYVATSSAEAHAQLNAQTDLKQRLRLKVIPFSGNETKA